VSAGDFDAVFRLSADARLARPPHSLGHHFPPALLLSHALAQPRFAFVHGVSSRKPWDLTKHTALFRRWIIEEVEQLRLPGSSSAVCSDLLKMAVGGLLGGTQCQPEISALAAAAALQLGSVSAATARMSLPEKFGVPVLLQMLTDIDPKGTLGILRKWYPVTEALSCGGASRDDTPRHAARTNQRPSGSVAWRAADFGISPKTVVQRLLYHDRSRSSDGGCSSSTGGGRLSLLLQLSSVEFISHFGLQAAFPQVLLGLLTAGEINSAVKFSLGATEDCVKAQSITLKHVASTDLLPVRLASQVNDGVLYTQKLPPMDERGTGRASNERQGGNGTDETVRPGGTAALLAVNFNPTKKATIPIKMHMWTLQNTSPLRISELQCSIIVVDTPEALCEAEVALSPLLRQAASAILARENRHQQVRTNGISSQQVEMSVGHGREQDQEPLEIEWPLPEELGYPLLGLDTESPPVKAKGATSRVSLLQVFTSS
jgi:hypothetical protein